MARTVFGSRPSPPLTHAFSHTTKLPPHSQSPSESRTCGPTRAHKPNDAKTTSYTYTPSPHFTNLNSTHQTTNNISTFKRSKLSEAQPETQSLKRREMGRRTSDAEAELNLPPGFRFHPTDEELVIHYLCRKVTCQRLPVSIIAEVDLYKYNPWELPEKALFGQREWYFFTPRDRKYPNGSRPNRAAGRGYWKATGADKPVSPSGSKKPLGIKKALVFYSGKAPRGVKTDWIMHEYRLADTNRAANKKGSLRLDDWVLCRLYNKKNNWEKMQQQKEQSSSLGETMDSLEATDDARSESFRSDIDNDSFPEFEDLAKPQLFPSQVSRVTEHQQKKEDSDWFMDLNLDDLQNSFGDFGSAATGFGMSNQDYFLQVLGSPMMKPSQNNLPPF